jgi:transposase InsO family protein
MARSRDRGPTFSNAEDVNGDRRGGTHVGVPAVEENQVALTGDVANLVREVWRQHVDGRSEGPGPVGHRSSKTTAVRYERSRPGELVHMDVKKLARIPDGGGWRAHGRAATVDHRHKSVPTGFDCVHSLVDDHSRLAYSEILGDEKGVTCAAFLARAAAYFANHGIPRIERVMTDNAWAYRYSLREVITALGARQKFIRPHCPWQNGNVERLNRTLATEWAYRQAFTNNAQRAAALAPWLEHYNTRRRHSALGGKPPLSRLAPT